MTDASTQRVSSPRGIVWATHRAPMLFAIVASFAMVVVRIAEAQADPIAWLRVALGLATMGFVLFSRQRSFTERALLAFCVEAVAAIAMFVFVDAPFVNEHVVQIVQAGSAIYDGVLHRDLVRDIRSHERASAAELH